MRHYYHLLLCREDWRNREKQNYQGHHKKAGFFHLAEFQNGFYCFLFKKMLSSIPMLLIIIFVRVGKHSNSHSQMFFKTGVPKFLNIHMRTPVLESPFNKVVGLKT